MKQITFILLLAAVMCSCSNNSFKIDGNLTNLEEGVVRVTFMGDSGVVDETVNTDKKGHFTFNGSAEQPVLVSLLTRRGEPIVMVVAANGDHIKVKGDASKAMDVAVKGNRLNEDWQLFRDEHKAFYTDPNPSRLDAAIEKYVREHPADVLSTVLLMADYSNYDDLGKVDKMLKGIDAKARPESLTQAFQGLNKKGNSLPRLLTLNLWKHGERGFEEIKLAGDPKILSLWANPQKDREDMRAKMKGVLEGAGGRIRVIDILAESDTMGWHKAIAGEEWPHYWAPGGPLEQGIQLLGITSLPWFAVTDSTGLVVYSGPSLDDALGKAVKK